jgi:hypothetical protein
MKQIIKIGILIPLIIGLAGCGAPGDPIDELYSQNVLPGTTNTYDVGSPSLTYDKGYFEDLRIGGAIDMDEVDPPGNPSPDTLRLYVEDFKGFPFYSFRDSTGMVRKIVRDSVFVGKNETGVTIPAFRVVYAAGSVDDVPSIALARSNSAATMPAIGVTTEASDNGSYVRVMQVGLLENLDTSALSAGDILYVHSTIAGLVQVTAPTSPNTRQEIGTVLVSDAVLGSIQVVARSAFDDSLIDFSQYGTISQVNTDLYVDKEATGAGDCTSWADACTDIQEAVDALPDTVIHAYTIHVRDGTKKTGTADSNVLNKLHDTGEFPATTTWVGRRVFNIGGTGPGDNWGVVSARDSDDQLSIVDQVTGAALDLFPNGNEAYVIEPTPYRETVYLNSLPATNPSKLILGSLSIEAEFYFGAICDANAVAGAIVDATYDFSDIEVGDRVFVLDLNGANGRAQNYKLGTVDDVTNAATGTLGTNLTVTPTTNWRYTIVKTEISGSDDGVDSGTARSYLFFAQNSSAITFNGFYGTFSDSICAYMFGGSRNNVSYNIFENCDYGLLGTNYAQLDFFYNYANATQTYTYAVGANRNATVVVRYCALGSYDTTGYSLYALVAAVIESRYNYLFEGKYGVYATSGSAVALYRDTIANTHAIGIYARSSSVTGTQTTNSGVVPEDPAGTTENAYIGVTP